MRRAPLPRSPRAATVAVVLAIVGTLLAGCAVGPDTGPGLVIDNGGGGGGPAASTEAPAAPELIAPRTDLGWRACPTDVAGRYGLSAPAADVRIECADFQASITPGVATIDAVDVAAVRVRLTSTPASAAPLVLTSGSDMPSALTALLVANSPGRSLLTAHPLVAIDRRGTGASSPLDCLTVRERNTLLDNGFDSSDAASGVEARETRLAATAAEASDGCSETISPHQLAYTAANAAGDLERLRTIWGVDRIGILGVGAGSDVALAYAGLYRNRVARLVLDTPPAYLASARDRAQQVAAGTDSAVTTFATDCAASNCSLGTDARAAVLSLIDRAAAGRLATLSDADVLSAITTELAVTTTDRASTVARVSRLLSSAAAGDVGGLTAAATRARALRGTDGQLLSRCNDTSQPVGQNEIGGLVSSWSGQYRFTGTDTALSLLRCSGWPAGPAAPRPEGFDVPVLLLTSGYDTINGGTGAGALEPLFVSARAKTSTVTWDGLGFSVTAHSDCAADIVARYAESGAIPDTGACPS
ncbi:alpha/beta fold hydrolase [Williamsia sp. M5A3_1d]